MSNYAELLTSTFLGASTIIKLYELVAIFTITFTHIYLLMKKWGVKYEQINLDYTKIFFLTSNYKALFSRFGTFAMRDLNFHITF